MGELALVGEALPGGAGAGLAAVDAAVGDPVGAGPQQLDRARLGEALLRLRHLGPDPVAGQRAGDEDDEAVGAGDAAPAEGERVDLDLEQLAATGAAGRRLLAGGLRHRQPSFLRARRAAWVACLRTGSARPPTSLRACLTSCSSS